MGQKSPTSPTILISPERVREILHYDPETGIFTWLSDRGTNRLAGRRAGYKRSTDGYWVICIEGRSYLAHRLAWAYVTGEWPENEIDHKNGLTDENAFANLREATHTQNMKNRKRKSSFTGASRGHRSSRWEARISVDGKTKHLGTFDTQEDAAKAYRAAANQHYGEFAKVA